MHDVNHGKSIAVFRPDVAGLRCLAMSVVVLYHFGVPGFGGGFIGVDIFFVISGYLMTSILFNQINDISISRFYASRVLRIVPAQIAMIAILLFFGFLYIEPVSYKSIAESAVYATLFLSNFYFAFSFGYFDAASEGAWLLHTWTLGAEWQFYLFYPLVFWVASSFDFFKNKIFSLILIGFALSFTLSIFSGMASPRVSTLGFYLLPTRAWEMLSGAIVFYASLSSVFERLIFRIRQHLEIAGILACFCSVFIFDHSTPWPSFRALLPVAGAALVLVANRQDRSLLRFSPFQLLGDWSYSIYLWHWPVAVLLRELGYFDIGIFKLCGIAGSALLGFISHSLIEHPTRLIKSPENRVIMLRTLGGLSTAASCLAMAIILQSGLPSRAARQSAILADATAASSEARPATVCQNFQGGAFCPAGASDATTAIVGDSHSLAWLSRYGLGSDAAAQAMWAFSCPPMPGIVSSKNPQCAKFHEAAISQVKSKKFKTVIYTAYWESYFQPHPKLCPASNIECESSDLKLVDSFFADFYSEISSLSALGIKVVVMLSIPTPNSDLPKDIRTAEFFGGKILPDQRALALPVRDPGSSEIERRLRLAADHGATIVDPRNSMCRQNSCEAISADGRSLYADSNHLRPWVVRERFSFLDAFVHAQH